MEIFNKKRIIIGVFVILSVLLLVSIFLGVYLYHNKDEMTCNEAPIVKEEIAKEVYEKESQNKWYVEVKGAVKKPGVYEVNDKSIIMNVIDNAGGFKKDAYTNNINLSKKLEDEMVIYVFTKNEYKKSNKTSNIKVENKTCTSNNYEIDKCISSNVSVITSNDNTSNNSSDNQTSITPNETNEDKNDIVSENNNKLININTASLSELSSLTGIGESKAQAIIDYRTQNGNFQKIEDIKKVSGIGDATYEKFKGNITV